MGLTAIARATLGAAVKTATGRRSKWAVLAVGVVLAGLAGPLASKLVPLEKNSPSSFLPSGAASTEVLDYQEAHGTGITPAVVVYERPGGLRPADKAVVRQARVSLDAALPRLAGAGAPGPVEFSSNGRAASFSVPIRATTADQVLDNDVKAIRGIVSNHAAPAGTEPGRSELQVAVGGPAGSAADAVNAFAGIDGKLLVITGLIVAVLLLLTYRSPVLWLLPLLSVGMAVSWSQGAAYALAKLGFTVNGMTVGILTVLVFGAGTDYALLLVARYREELQRHEDHHEAMAVALAGPPLPSRCRASPSYWRSCASWSLNSPTSPLSARRAWPASSVPWRLSSSSCLPFSPQWAAVPCGLSFPIPTKATPRRRECFGCSAGRWYDAPEQCG